MRAFCPNEIAPIHGKWLVNQSIDSLEVDLVVLGRSRLSVVHLVTWSVLRW